MRAGHLLYFPFFACNGNWACAAGEVVCQRRCPVYFYSGGYCAGQGVTGAASCTRGCLYFVEPAALGITGCIWCCPRCPARAVMPGVALYARWAIPALMPLYGRALSLQLSLTRAGAVQAL